jgi:hypothetical protein
MHWTGKLEELVEKGKSAVAGEALISTDSASNATKSKLLSVPLLWRPTARM